MSFTASDLLALILADVQNAPAIIAQAEIVVSETDKLIGMLGVKTLLPTAQRLSDDEMYAALEKHGFARGRIGGLIGKLLGGIHNAPSAPAVPATPGVPSPSPATPTPGTPVAHPLIDSIKNAIAQGIVNGFPKIKALLTAIEASGVIPGGTTGAGIGTIISMILKVLGSLPATTTTPTAALDPAHAEMMGALDSALSEHLQSEMAA